MSFSVRRLSALDLYGSNGTTFRRRIVAAEFLLAIVVAMGIAVVLIAHLASALWIVVLIGVGLNYVPLAVHAIRFLGPGRLDAELAGVDVDEQRRSHSLAMLLLFVPGLVFLLGLRPSDWKRPHA